MADYKDFFSESMLFNFIDEFKFLFFPDQWSSVFLDYSKNEILAMLFIYRKEVVNMTEVAEYINAPLNTATGVISRLEKKMIAQRTRDLEDKRVVKISLTEKGKAFIEAEKKIVEHYFTEISKVLTQEEKAAGVSMISKIITVLKADNIKQEEKEIKKVKRIFIE